MASTTTEQALTRIGASVPIAGTIGETYLRERLLDTAAIPDGVVRWHEGDCQLVWVLRGAGGQIQACNRHFFSRHDGKTLLRDGKKKRLNEGPVKGAAIRVPGNGGAVLVCEGGEDGLSLHQATGQTVLAAVGGANMASLALPEGAAVTIVVDRDAAGQKHAKKAAEEFTKRGHKVSLAVPPDGSKDSNELLVRQGIDAVRELVGSATPHEPPNPEPEPGKATTGDDVKAEAVRLAKLPPHERIAQKRPAAKKLQISVGDLEEAIRAELLQEDNSKLQGRPLEFPPPESWEYQVDGALLLDEILELYKRLVIAEDSAYVVITLWTAATWFI